MANRPQAFDPKVLTISDLREKGSEKLPTMYREYFNEGSMDMITLCDNEESFNRYKIRPRVLVNVSNIDTSTEIFGTRVPFPLGFAPTAMHKLAHPDGEVATSKAAAGAGICMGLSAYATTSMEDVAAQGSGNPYVLQLSILRDRDIAMRMIKRAEKAGFKAIFLTVDCPVLGLRLNEYRNNLTMPEGLCYPNLVDSTEPFSLSGSDTGKSYDSGITWEDVIPWLRSQTKMQLWVKGVYTADDVVLAIRHGLDGIVISNHGGRQLDGVPATLDALRECAPAAANKIQIAIDGGIRRGSDIFKALALGAQHCFVGRVPIWGLAYDGQAGVELALKILMAEFKLTMGLAGCKSVKEINRGHLSLLGTDGILSKL